MFNTKSNMQDYFELLFHSNGQRVSKRKLNYRFHNPNPVEVTADYILEILIEANKGKVEKILQEEIDQEEKELKKID